MTCRWPFFTLLVAVFLGSCKTPLRTSQLSDLTAEQEQEILGYAYDEAFREADHPRDTLGLETRKIHAIGPHCGYRDSHLKIFKESVDGLRGYFTENVWRRYPIPRVGQDCGPGETLENGYCWQSYGLQFYPSDKRNNTSARTISNTSPLIRLVQKQSYPEDTAACRIDGKNVLIWVGGIRNPKMGTSWQNTDKELLGAIMAWHSRPSLPVLPGGNNKLRGELAYIQLVENNGAYVSGILGKHDEVAIRRLANNLKLAYVAGAHGVEIISHSNGAITTQMGLQLFLDEMSEQNSASLRAGRRQVEGAPTKMDINIFHIQGAPSQKWSLSALNTFKS